ncbi:transposase, partial [Helicobacter monodelphidis]|uniref:RNA-guided endonuclease InsQ/TnpB family protein n=1 Tax=Helicobacter sp. 15-1451 TaxID=2004995 RepID=UPI000DCF4B8D
KTHKSSMQTKQGLGIDIGLKSCVCLSNGLSVKAPKPLAKLTRKLKRVSRQLSKKQHPKTKGEALAGIKKSNNYLKQSLKLSRLHRQITNVRSDFLHKLTTSLVRHYAYFGIENLNVSGMLKNHKLAKAISDVSFYEFKRQLQYKSNYYKREVIEADRFYPSSKTCFNCGSIKENLTLKDRIYICNSCGISLDRDFNASLNLLNYAKNKIGLVQAEFTPEDLTALQCHLAINNIVTSKVETGIQQKSYL